MPFGIDFGCILVSILVSFSSFWVSGFRMVFGFDIFIFFIDFTSKMDPEMRPNP